MTELKKKLTLYGLTMIAIGSCIGSGIFISPSEVVKSIPDPIFALIVWAIGGLIALTGSLTFSELGSMYPHSGGVYVYLKKAFGDKLAFLYGWIILLVINTGALAALSLAFANYLTFFIPLTDSQKVMIAMVVILGLTLINVRGVSLSQMFSNVFTGLKLLALLAIVVLGAFVFGDTSRVFHASTNFLPSEHPQAFLTGLIGVLWSFGGWHHASYLAGEAIDAKRTVPKAMIIGTIVVTIIYLTANFAYFSLLNLEEFAASQRVAGDAMNKIFTRGGQMVSLAIMISVFGTIGIYTMSAPRIYYAMAKDKIFFDVLAKVHPKFSTPYVAMWFQAVWACILLMLWGTFTELITYTTFMDIVFMSLAGISLIVLRYKDKAIERPIKVPLYPVVPLIFILISVAFVFNTLIVKPQQAIAGVILLLVGFIAYYYFSRKSKA